MLGLLALVKKIPIAIATCLEEFDFFGPYFAKGLYRCLTKGKHSTIKVRESTSTFFILHDGSGGVAIYGVLRKYTEMSWQLQGVYRKWVVTPVTIMKSIAVLAFDL